MKNIFTYLVIFFFGFTMLRASAQTTLVLQPDALAGKDAPVYNCVSCGYLNRNFGNQAHFNAVSWTFSGSPSDSRSFIQFDLSTLPANAILQQARLSLYANPAGGHSSQDGPNNTLLRRVTAGWNEATITWNNQPPTTAQNQVTLPATNNSAQDFTNIDVTALVQDMRPAGQNFGFMLRLVTESYYRKAEFVSSDHSNPALRPKLEITYALPTGIARPAETGFRLEPNPMRTQATLQFRNPAKKPYTLSLYNVIGKKVSEITGITSEEVTITKKNLPAGIYYFRLAYQQEIKASGKLVIE